MAQQIGKFAYTVVYVKDVPQSIAFYKKAFGINIRRLDQSERYGIVLFGSEDVQCWVWLDSSTLSLHVLSSWKLPALIDGSVSGFDCKTRLQECLLISLHACLKPLHS